ncbi:hypothetical protein EIP86_007933 [Pleurotus ostreatoroseus]|nr:hypothetical protein EIP86_007933 [Pleurotus ostreatoroseus]
MSSRTLLSSFDPLAVHPFTNNSGLLPQPTPPSQYPQAIPSPASSTHSTPSSSPTPGLVHAPQPKAPSPQRRAGHPARAPVFVPFRPERSSPELDEILLKKKISDALANKQPWSIDQVSVSPPAASHHGARR